MNENDKPAPLRSCPWCNNADLSIESDDMTPTYRIRRPTRAWAECKRCGATGPVAHMTIGGIRHEIDRGEHYEGPTKHATELWNGLVIRLDEIEQIQTDEAEEESAHDRLRSEYERSSYRQLEILEDSRGE
jgi:hypothetical protein